MIVHILLAIWLVPTICFFLGIVIASMIKEDSLLPFDEWFEVFILIPISLVWPVVGVFMYKEYSKQRQLKLDQTKEYIEAHYKHKWYEEI